MRRFFRVLSVLLGLLLLVVGAGAMVLVGPDDTVTSGDHLLHSKTSAITTWPKLLQYYGPTLRVSARSTTGKPVFVGVAGQADADSYLANTPRDVVDKFTVPWALHSTTTDKGAAAQPVKPAGLDFWIVSTSGNGDRTVAWPIENGPYSVVIMNADASPGVSVRIRAGLQIAHAFATATVVAVVGLLLIAVGWLVLRRRSPKVAA